MEKAMRRSGVMEKHNKGGDADKQPAGRISRLLHSGVLRAPERRQMGRRSVLGQICLSLCLPKYSVLIPSASPQLCHCCTRLSDHYASIHPSVIYSYPHTVEAESEECKTGRPETPCGYHRIFLRVSQCAAVPACRPGCTGCSRWRYRCCMEPQL